MSTTEKQLLYEQQLNESTTPEDAAKYLNLLKALKEIEKIDADIKKAEADAGKADADVGNITYIRQTDWIRFVGLLAPMVTSIILIITLMIQVSQTKEARLAQRQEKEDEQWKALTDKLSTPNASYNETIPPLIKAFFKSERYKNTAIELSTNYLSNVRNEDTFNSLFKEYVKTIDRDNYSYLVRLTRKLINQYYTAQSQKVIDSTALRQYDADSSKSRANGQTRLYLSQRVNEDDVSRDRATSQLITASRGLAALIRQFTRNASHSTANGGSSLDLTDAYFYKASLDSVSLNGVVVDNVAFEKVSFFNADLTNLKGLETSSWYGSAWWQASAISPALLNHLIKFPYDPAAPGVEASSQANDYKRYLSWRQRAAPVNH